MQRTKRYYRGTLPTGKKISEVLPEMLKGLKVKSTDEKEVLFQFWYSLLGEKLGGLTQPISWNDGVLLVKVKSGALYATLCQHEKKRLLKAISAKFKVRDLVFRIG